MYIPENMAMEADVVTKFIADHGFGVMVSPSLEATHLPLLFERGEGDRGTLYGHLAKANRQWEGLEGRRVLVVFSGPHSYISPTWYERGPAVPTWNYAAVHCYGIFERLDEKQTARALEGLMDRHEPLVAADAVLMPDEFRRKLGRAVVGFRIVVDEIQAKEKLGQHRSRGDQRGVYEALGKSGDGGANALADYMKKRDLGTGAERSRPLSE